jgi:hypothetical protein
LNKTRLIETSFHQFSVTQHNACTDGDLFTQGLNEMCSVAYVSLMVGQGPLPVLVVAAVMFCYGGC